jgi:hypothetical protein
LYRGRGGGGLGLRVVVLLLVCIFGGARRRGGCEVLYGVLALGVSDEGLVGNIHCTYIQL